MLYFLFGFLFILLIRLIEVLVYEVKDLFTYKTGYLNTLFIFLVTISFFIGLCVTYNTIVFKLQNEAIDAYVMGNVEKVEVIKNGEVVDYHYKIIPTEYD